MHLKNVEKKVEENKARYIKASEIEQGRGCKSCEKKS